MSQHLLFLLVGLGAGAAYAAIAMALVTTFRGTGVINIAQGSIAVWAAFVFQDARVEHGIATLPAMLLGLGTVAAVGVTITLQALAIEVFGPARRAVPPTLPHEPVHLWGISFSRDRLWLAGVVLAIAAGLWAYGRFTRVGLATRAAAQSERGAV